MNQSTNQLINIVNQLLTSGKGLLAADESTKTITKRFAAIGLTSTPELNREYREMLFTTPGIEEFISGIIMFDETVYQSVHGKPFPQFVAEKGIVPGIKVDGGLEPFNGTEEEVTKGMEGLEQRLKEYSSNGLKFTKWRGAFRISDIFPTEAFLDENLSRMAKFAKISQENNLVPIVEPEILLKGNHTTARCEEISVKVWKKLFEKLLGEGVNLSMTILKTSMVLPGKDSGVAPAPLEIAHATLRSLVSGVPPAVPGVLFLSGGQTPDEATVNLNEIVKTASSLPAGRQAWQLSFSFARALQEEAMNTWAGKEENVKEAQSVFYKRASLVSKARRGQLE